MAKAKSNEVTFDFEEVKAEVKKTPAKKPSTKSSAPKKEVAEEVKVEVEPEKVEETIKEEIVEKPKTIKVTRKSKFEEGDLIPCKSVTSGGLNFIGTSGKKVRFADYGAIEYVEYGDLRREAQVVNNTNYLYYPRFIVLDPEFVEEFPKLEEFYSQWYSDEGDFEKILELPKDQMIEAIAKLPKGCKECLKGIVSTKLDDGTLDSVQKIKMLDEVFGTNMLITLANN